jgi:methylated-DNA-[protein]-cysteine S-methyltransferase
VRTLYFSRFASPVGPLKTAVSERGLAVLEFDGTTLTPAKVAANAVWVESEDRTREVCRQLADYFAGQRIRFDLPLDLEGTPFQLRCWAALQQIPFGQTISYAELAARVESPRGFRAVGLANHQNPVAIVVPCHRVLSSDGTLGGYGGGLAVKRQLLELERQVSGSPCPAIDQQALFAEVQR